MSCLNLCILLSYRFCKLWDTETGECISRFSSRKVPYCVKFNPDEDKQHLFVCGTSDKKILCWDTRSGEIVQEYDRHLGENNLAIYAERHRSDIVQGFQLLNLLYHDIYM